MPAKASVRFKDTPVAIRREEQAGGNTPLMKALSLDDSNASFSVSEDGPEKENNMSTLPERFNHAGHTPHSKTVEAARAKKNLEDLLKVPPMPMMEFSQFAAASPIKVAPESQLYAAAQLDASTSSPESVNLSIQTVSTPSSCSSYAFELMPTEAEEISSVMPQACGGSGRKSVASASASPFAGSSPAARPTLNRTSEDDALRSWSSGLGSVHSSPGLTLSSALTSLQPTPVIMHSATPASLTQSFATVSPAPQPVVDCSFGATPKAPTPAPTPAAAVDFVPAPQESQFLSPGYAHLHAHTPGQHTPAPSQAHPVSPLTQASGLVSHSSSLHATPASTMIQGLFSPSISALLTPSVHALQSQPSPVMLVQSAAAAPMAACPSPCVSAVEGAQPSAPNSCDSLNMGIHLPPHRSNRSSPISAFAYATSPDTPRVELATPIALNVSADILMQQGGVALGRGPSLGAASKPSAPRHPSTPTAVPAPAPVVHDAPVPTQPSAASLDSIAGIAMALSPPAKAWSTPRQHRKLPPHAPYRAPVGPVHTTTAAATTSRAAVPKPAVPEPSPAQQAARQAQQVVSTSTSTSTSTPTCVEVEPGACDVSIQCDASFLRGSPSPAYVSSTGKSLLISRVSNTSASVATHRQGAYHDLSPISGLHDHTEEVYNAREDPDAANSSMASSLCLEDLVRAAQEHTHPDNILFGKTSPVPQSANRSSSFSTLACTNIGPQTAAEASGRKHPTPRAVAGLSSRAHVSIISAASPLNTSAQSGGGRSALLKGAMRIATPSKGESIEETWGGADSDAESSTSSLTLNKSQFPSAPATVPAAVPDVTLLTDVAVANYTLEQVDDEGSVVSLDAMSAMTGPDATHLLDVSASGAYPRLSIKSLPRAASAAVGSSASVFDIKEVVLQAGPGEVTTVMLTFSNPRSREMDMSVNTVCVRFDAFQAVIGSSSGSAEVSTSGVFSVSPAELRIPGHGEEVVFVTFTPQAGAQGVYTGAMQIRQGRKKFTMLLRGEALSKHSVASPAASPATSPAHSASPRASAQTLTQPQPQAPASDKSTKMSEKLKVLHERVAEISRSVLWPDQSALPGSPAAACLSPSPAKAAQAAGICASPVAFSVQRSGSAHARPTLVIRGAFTVSSSFARPKVVRCRASSDLFLLSTSLLVLYPGQQQTVTLAVLPGREDALLTAVVGAPTVRGEVEVAQVLVSFDEQRLAVPITLEAKDVQALLAQPAGVHGHAQGRGADSSSSAGPRALEFAAKSTPAPVPPSRPAQLPPSFGHSLQAHSQMSHIHNQPHGHSRGHSPGLYFKKPELLFPTGRVHELQRGKIDLCNSTDRPLTVFLGDAPAPFVCVHSELTVKARGFVRLPVRFLPVTAGSFDREWVAQSEDGAFTATLALRGEASL